MKNSLAYKIRCGFVFAAIHLFLQLPSYARPGSENVTYSMIQRFVHTTAFVSENVIDTTIDSESIRLRDLCHLPLRETLVPGSNSHWLIATITPLGLPNSPLFSVYDERTGVWNEMMSPDNENNGLFYEGTIQVEHTLEERSFGGVTNFRVQLNTISSTRFGDAEERLSNLPFVVGGESLFQFFPAAKGNSKFAQIYLLPKGYGQTVADAFTFLERDQLLRQWVRRQGNPVKKYTDLVADYKNMTAHMARLLDHKNPIIVVTAYNALRQLDEANADYKIVIQQRIKTATGTEAELYEMLILSDGSQTEPSVDTKVAEARILEAKDYDSLYRLAVSVQAIERHSIPGRRLLDKIKTRFDTISANHKNDKEVQSSVAFKRLSNFLPLVPMPPDPDR